MMVMPSGGPAYLFSGEDADIPFLLVKVYAFSEFSCVIRVFFLGKMLVGHRVESRLTRANFPAEKRVLGFLSTPLST